MIIAFRQRALIALAALLLATLTGCDIGTQRGEDGNANFKTGDAMFGEFPYAVGVRAVVEVELTAAGRNSAGDRSALTVHSDDASVFTASWEEPGHRILLEATGPGQARIEVRRPDGTRFDRVTLSSEIADRLVVSWPKPLSTLFGPPPEDIAFDLDEVRIVEGGAPAELHLDIVDAAGDRLAGRVTADVSFTEAGVVAAGRTADSEGEISEETVRTNGHLVLLPLALGETQVALSGSAIDAEASLPVHVVPADDATTLVFDVDITTEAAADPAHAAGAIVRADLRDELGRTLFGGRCRFVNETPEIASIAPEVEAGEDGICWALLSAADGVELDTATIRVIETVSGLEAEIDVPVGAGSSDNGDGES